MKPYEAQILQRKRGGKKGLLFFDVQRDGTKQGKKGKMYEGNPEKGFSWKG